MVADQSLHLRWKKTFRFFPVHVAVLPAELFRVLAPLSVERRCSIHLPFEPALAEGVVVAVVERPALRFVAEDPRVAWLLLVCRLRCVRCAALAAFSSRAGAVCEAPSNCLAARVCMGLLATHLRCGDARAVGKARFACFGWRAHVIATHRS